MPALRHPCLMPEGRSSPRYGSAGRVIVCLSPNCLLLERWSPPMRRNFLLQWAVQTITENESMICARRALANASRQVKALRARQAGYLLTKTNDEVESIACEVAADLVMQVWASWARNDLRFG